MSDLVGNPKDRFSRLTAHIIRGLAVSIADRTMSFRRLIDIFPVNINRFFYDFALMISL